MANNRSDVETLEVPHTRGDMDLTQIQTVLGLATTAVGLTGKATATIEAVRNTFSAKSDEANAEAQQLLSSLATELTSANMMNLQLSSMLNDVVAQMKKEHKFEKRLAKYELIESSYGDVIYSLKSENSDSEPHHYICPICIEKNEQFHFVTGSHASEGKHCQGCNHYFQFKQTDRLPRRSSSGYSI